MNRRHVSVPFLLVPVSLRSASQLFFALGPNRTTAGLPPKARYSQYLWACSPSGLTESASQRPGVPPWRTQRWERDANVRTSFRRGRTRVPACRRYEGTDPVHGTFLAQPDQAPVKPLGVAPSVGQGRVTCDGLMAEKGRIGRARRVTPETKREPVIRPLKVLQPQIPGSARRPGMEKEKPPGSGLFSHAVAGAVS